MPIVGPIEADTVSRRDQQAHAQFNAATSDEGKNLSDVRLKAALLRLFSRERIDSEESLTLPAGIGHCQSFLGSAFVARSPSKT